MFKKREEIGMNFSVNFMERANVVLKEALKMKKYKAMPLALAIVVGIFMLPLVLASFICAALVFISGYLYFVASQPVQSLHKLLREEGQNVKHGTQVVVYLLSWSVVFGAYALLSLLLISLTVQYTLFAIITYLWTLGGFKFHAFASEEDISIEVEGKYKIGFPIVFIAVMGALLVILPAINTISAFVKYDYGVTFNALATVFKIKMHSTDVLRLLFSVLYSAVVFAPFPKK